MNLPNRLTLLRICMIPFIVFCMMTELIPYHRLVALGLFILACLTDWLDGYIARKYNLVTTLGKFLDPLADKVLVISVLICFIELGFPQVYLTTIVIVFRELAITGFRIIAAEKKVVIAASKLGKYKTTFQMVWVVLLFLPITNAPYSMVTEITMYVVLILTIVSFMDYIYKNREVIR